MNYEWDFSGVWAHRDMLMAGFVGTMKIAAVAIAVGVGVGIVLAVMRLSGKRWLALPALWFIEFYRNTPPLVHFFWAFYALPVLIGVSLDPYVAAVIALSTQSGAFFAEVFRGGIKAVERGQWEAGRALGLSRTRLMVRIILPQAARRMAAPFVERSFELVKTTTLAAALAFHETIYSAMVIVTTTYRPLEVYTVVAVIFFLILFSASQVAEWLEARGRKAGAR